MTMMDNFDPGEAALTDIRDEARQKMALEVPPGAGLTITVNDGMDAEAPEEDKGEPPGM